MNAIIVVGSNDFVQEAGKELENKGLGKLCNNVFAKNNISNFDTIARGLRELQSYKKQQNKNSIYKTSSLTKIG